MRLLRYPAIALVAFLLLVGLGIFFFHRNLAPNDPTPVPSEGGDRDVVFPDKPSRVNPPVVVAVVAAYPGTSAEEVERQVTIPLELAFTGTPHLQTVRSKSIAGFSWLHVRFELGTDYHAARQEVINCLQFIQNLPPGVSPQIAPGPVGATLRYVLVAPRDDRGLGFYTLNDLRTLQDWHLEREFRRLPGVADVSSSGGTINRYEVVPDPDRLRRYGITLPQLVDALARSNANVATERLVQGSVTLNVRSVGLFGAGVDPLSAEVLTATDPRKAAQLLRAVEQQRLREIRTLVVAKVHEQPVLVGDLVEGGPALPGAAEGSQGVVVGHQPRLGRVACSGPGQYEDADIVQGIVHLRLGEDPRLLHGVRDRIRELNATAGKLLPGVRIEPYDTDNDGGTGVLWVYGTFPLNTSLERIVERARGAAQLLREFPEVDRVVFQVGTTAEGDLPSSNHLQLFVGLKAGPDVPAVPGRDRPRSRAELLGAFTPLISNKVPGVEWWTTMRGPEELGMSFPGAPAEHLLKILGPDLNELERLAESVPGVLRNVAGIEGVAAYHSPGPSRPEFRIDADKCRKWGVTVADVSAVLQPALGGSTISRMLEGEKSFDITVRWPKGLRESETAILDLPIDVTNNKIDVGDPIKSKPRLRLRDLVSPIGKDGEPDPKGKFMRSGVAAIYREQGTRLIPVRFSVSGRPLADVRAEAAKKIAPLLKAPYRIEWSD